MLRCDVATARSLRSDWRGAALVVLPAAAVVAEVQVPSSLVTPVHFVTIAVTAVMVGSDAARWGQPARRYVALAIGMWIAGLPFYAWKRRTWGAPNLLTYVIPAVAAFAVAPLFRYAARAERASVLCGLRRATWVRSRDASQRRECNLAGMKERCVLTCDRAARRTRSWGCAPDPPSRG